MGKKYIVRLTGCWGAWAAHGERSGVQIKCQPGGADLRQVEHPHPRFLVQSPPASRSTAAAWLVGESLHPQAWELVGHRWNRTERVC